MATTQTNLGYSSPPTAKVFSYLKFSATALEGLGNKMQGLSVKNETKVVCSFPKFFTAGTTASTWTGFTRTDCVLRASFLLLEVRTGTGVAGASVSSTAGVVFFFMKHLLRFRRHLVACFCARSAILSKASMCLLGVRVTNVFFQLLRSFHGINQLASCCWKSELAQGLQVRL